jgi:hypothetical protein
MFFVFCFFCFCFLIVLTATQKKKKKKKIQHKQQAQTQRVGEGYGEKAQVRRYERTLVHGNMRNVHDLKSRIVEGNYQSVSHLHTSSSFTSKRIRECKPI